MASPLDSQAWPSVGMAPQAVWASSLLMPATNQSVNRVRPPAAIPPAAALLKDSIGIPFVRVKVREAGKVQAFVVGAGRPGDLERRARTVSDRSRDTCRPAPRRVGS